eukprot:gene21493-26506_t
MTVQSERFLILRASPVSQGRRTCRADRRLRVAQGRGQAIRREGSDAQKLGWRCRWTAERYE